MPFQIIINDITTMKVDAIVNAANGSLLGGGGVDGAIHRAAGPQLLTECRLLGGCQTGQAKITKGYRLPARYIIHAVGPVWSGGQFGEQELLTSAYRNSLELALAHDCRTVAFPLISSGVYGYPKGQALKVAADTIGEFLSHHDMMVYLVIFEETDYTIGESLFADIKAYISGEGSQENANGQKQLNKSEKYADESFSQMLIRKIDEQEISRETYYRRANLEPETFDAICSDMHKPDKSAAIALAVALALPLDETEELLGKAGYSLSGSQKSDIIAKYFITHRNDNVFEMNAALFAI